MDSNLDLKFRELIELIKADMKAYWSFEKNTHYRKRYVQQLKKQVCMNLEVLKRAVDRESAEHTSVTTAGAAGQEYCEGYKDMHNLMVDVLEVVGCQLDNLNTASAAEIDTLLTGTKALMESLGHK